MFVSKILSFLFDWLLDFVLLSYILEKYFSCKLLLDLK